MWKWKWRLAPVFVVVVATIAGCESSTPPPPAVAAATPRAFPPGFALATPAVSKYTGPPRGMGSMSGTRASRMTESLRAAGLDIHALPPLESLAPGPKQRVMRTFTEALGIPCLGCHAPDDDFTADTKRKRVARRMWNEIVRVVEMKDGAPVYCDSCHDGALFHLDRRNKTELAAYMCNAMISNLRRSDGRAHDCTTCHGDPPDLNLIASWKASPAPIITSDEATPGALIPTLPKEWKRDPEDCGPGGVNCPLAAFMRLVVAPAASKEDRRELARALNRVATWAPDLDGFTADARVAASAASLNGGGDPIAIRDACGSCHKKHKETWVTQYRRREAAK